MGPLARSESDFGGAYTSRPWWPGCARRCGGTYGMPREREERARTSCAASSHVAGLYYSSFPLFPVDWGRGSTVIVSQSFLSRCFSVMYSYSRVISFNSISLWRGCFYWTGAGGFTLYWRESQLDEGQEREEGEIKKPSCSPLSSSSLHPSFFSPSPDSRKF